MSAGQIIRIDPPAGVVGGEVIIECSDFDTSDPGKCSVWFSDEQAQTIALGPKRVLAIIPDLRRTSKVQVTLRSGELQSAPADFVLGKRIAEDVHPVANPAFDPDDGALFVTRSGSRGEQQSLGLT